MKTMIVDAGKQELLAWKCAQEDFEFGAHLVVHESQQAVFFRDGQAVEVLGPGTHILETANLPFLRYFTKLRFGRYFHCQVYFINQSIQMAVPWGTRQRLSVELEVSEGKTLPLAVGASGTMNLQVDPEQVLKFLTYLVGTGAELSREGIQALFASMLNSMIKNYLANVLQDQNCNAFTLDRQLGQISSALQQRLSPEFSKYGMILREFYVETFVMPEEDPSYQQAKLLRNKQVLAFSQQELEHGMERKQAEHEATLAAITAQKTLTEAETAAKATVITAQGEAARRSYEGITSIQEHQFDTMNRMIDANAQAAANGGAAPIGGGMGDMTGLFGDMMKMGVGMQMMKEMSGVMKDAMNTGAQTGSTMAAATVMNPQPAAPTWTCGQGHVNPASSLFCCQCGQRKPEPEPQTWTCSQGHVNPASSLFCCQCGQRKPEPEPQTWTCSQGHVNPASSLFCSTCGEPKGGNH